MDRAFQLVNDFYIYFFAVINICIIVISFHVILKAEDGLKAREVPVGCVMIYKNHVVASSRNTTNETKSVNIFY